MIWKKYVWLGLIGALLLIYPNLICIPWHVERCEVQAHLVLFSVWHVIRFLYFAVLIMVIYRLNVVKGWTTGRRVAVSVSLSALAYALFAYTSHSLLEYGVRDKVGTVLILQFIVICGVLEVRYAGKLTFDIQIENQHKTQYMLPVLTLLPVIENVIVHNRIDTAHTMTVSITVNEHGELVVSNPIHPKQQEPMTNGIGLKNLANRLELMSGRKLRTVNEDGCFTVYVPLKG